MKTVKEEYVVFRKGEVGIAKSKFVSMRLKIYEQQGSNNMPLPVS